MGKLSDAIKEYKISPIGSPAEREAEEIIKGIVESEWWDTNVGKEFKWPKKYKKYKQFEYSKEQGYTTIGNWLVPKWDYDSTVRLLTKWQESS
jgi:hypothetical protein